MPAHPFPRPDRRLFLGSLMVTAVLAVGDDQGAGDDAAARAFLRQSDAAMDTMGTDGPLVVESPVFDLGQVLEGTVLPARFTLRNTGTQPVEIHSVTPTCGCLVGDDAWARSLAPGATTTVAASIRTERLSGPIRKTIDVVTGGHRQPRLSLAIIATVVSAIEISPPYGNLGVSVPGDRVATQDFAITNHTAAPLTLGGATSSSPHFTAALREVETGRRWTLTVGTMPPVAPGPHTAMIRIDRGPAQEPLSVSMSAVVVSPTP